MWFYLLIGGFLVFIGILVHVFKWHFLISGYNTMSKERKAKVNITSLARLMGIYLYVNGALFVVAGILQILGLKITMTPVFIFFTLATIYMIFKAQKFDGNIYNENGDLQKGAKKHIILVVVILFIVLIFLATILFFSFQETKITFLEEGIQIHGMYGDVYTWDSIVDIKLEDTLPTIESRTNGSAIGSRLKGHFRTTELGSVLLFVDSQTPPFIYLETETGIIVLNGATEAETQTLFDKMIDSKEIEEIN